MSLRRIRTGSQQSSVARSVELDMSVVSRDSTRRTAGSRARGAGFTFGVKQKPTRHVSLAIKEGSDENSDSAEETASASSNGLSVFMANRSLLFSLLVGIIGLLASTLFLGFGIAGAVREQEGLFNLRAQEAATELQNAWKDYEAAARWLHQACTLQEITYRQFTDVYEYLTYELEVTIVQWVTRIDHEDREDLEETSNEFFMNKFPNFDYQGITGLEPDPESPTGESVQNRSLQPFYYPIHFFEPLEPNLALADFDMYSSANQREAMDMALDTFQPAVSKPFFPRELNTTVSEQLIMLLHPGIPLSSKPDGTPRDLAALLVETKALIRIIAQNMPESLTLYLYDSTEDQAEPTFIIAAEVIVESLGDANITYIDKIGYQELADTTVVFKSDFSIPVAQNTEWTLAVVAVDETFEPNVLFIILIGKFTLVVCLCVALWIFYNMRRTKMLQEVKRRADAEKAAMIVSSARETAKVEQDLNDYIAHEVRNPLAAALSACSFVKSSVYEKVPMKDEESILSVREDVDIIESSLSFMNDLLRSMLDMHRAASKKIQVKFVPVDVRQDILQPVATMLYGRDMNFEVIIECPDGLEVLTDRLRLKQVVLNLGRNATKFVRKGFVKLGAMVVGGHVRVFVADSGYGISKERRKNLFSKFQESLDVMNQGTGMGLCLCKNMTQLMSGEIWLDETYESGIEGYPGTRFIIDLRIPPLSVDACEEFIPYAYQDSQPTRKVTIHEPINGTEKTQQSETEDLEAPAVASPAPLFNTSTASEPAPLFSTSAATGQPTPLFATASSPTPAPLFSSTPARAQAAPLFSPSPALAQPSPLFSIGATGAQNGSSATNAKAVVVAGKNPPPPQEDKPAHELPKALSILFVDDDLVLRKLFMRSVRKAVTGWTIKDAANGETALQMVETDQFDIIFVDQYMASVEKQLLGTETTRALRSKGVKSRICGLSANDVEQEFLKCGADFFLFKPFPCKPDELRKELHHIIYSKSIRTESEKARSTQEHSDSTSQLTQSTVGDEGKPTTSSEQDAS